MLYALLRRLTRPRLACYTSHERFFSGRIGLEIGGPSDVFRGDGVFPVYGVAGRVDNCNFGAQTLWEGAVREGPNFHFDRRHAPGRQYITEATDLGFIADAAYDFVLSSHALEHIANPLRALSEWKRVLKPGGMMVLVVPDSRRTFDHRRPVTTLEHMVEDFERDTPESDATHLQEILELHDLKRDPWAGDFESFRTRSLHNTEYRALHHHVFDAATLEGIAGWLELRLCALTTAAPHHVFVLAEKI